MTKPKLDVVAWVDGCDSREAAKLAALLLAARGARVLVTGEGERALGACVGEIAHGAGKARHLVATAATDEGAGACVRGAVERFGAIGCALVARADETRARGAMPAGSLVVAFDADDESAARAAVDAIVSRLG